jgi:glycosyltransferase involved in cell wall biosynthesis
MNVLIVGNEKNGVSQTFVQQHIQAFAKGTEYIYGAKRLFYHHDEPLFPKSILARAAKRLPVIGNWFQPEAYLLRFVKNRRYDVVLAEFGNIGADILPTCKKCNLPLVVHFHGYDASINAVVQLYKERYLELFAYAFAVIAVSTKMVRDLEKMGCNRKKIILNTYGPHIDFFDSRPLFSSPHFLSIGRFVEKKAPLLTLRAFVKVYSRMPTAHLTMVGDGALWQKSKKLADTLGISHKVNFKGALPHKKVIRLMEKASVFVQHSITAPDGDCEGTPVAVLEAGAAALPVVATRHAGIMDVVIEGETGFLVDEGDIDGMADAMLKLIVDSSIAKTMGAKARVHIKNNFNIERHIGNLRDILQKAASSRTKNQQ